MYQQHLKDLKKELDEVIKYYSDELAGLHTGRATPAILEDVAILAYDSSMPLKQLAVITSLESRALSVQPWDREILANIETAIRNQKPNLSPSVVGDIVRVTVPGLNEEQRKEMVKIVKKRMEETRIKIRQRREDALQKIHVLEKENQLREDDKFRAKDELQEIIDEYNKKANDMAEEKEKEIMTI